MVRRLRWVFVVAGLLAGLSIWTIAFPSAENLLAPTMQSSMPAEDPLWSMASCQLEPGWAVKPIHRFPAPINSLLAPPVNDSSSKGEIYVGTSQAGGVYRLNPNFPKVAMTISHSLGESKTHGECWVNRLAVQDIDGDGIKELIASTSQVMPRGRPNFYVWSLESTIPVFHSIARPHIQSSWSHGLGFLPRNDSHGDSMFVTYCGFGEIVEYQYEQGRDANGFRGDELSWKQVGNLESSGEGCQTADLDNDEIPEICLATGYGENKAKIQSFTSAARGATLKLNQSITENYRFSNVQFIVGDMRGDGTNDVVAWWCSDHIHGGACEVIRYHVNSKGIQDRTVIAQGKARSLFPGDGQTLLLDLDNNGFNEVWFASKDGILWRYDPRSTPSLTRVLKGPPHLGPIAAWCKEKSSTEPPSLFLGWGRDLIKLERITALPGESPSLPDNRLKESNSTSSVAE